MAIKLHYFLVVLYSLCVSMQRRFLLLVVSWCAGLLSVFATGNYSTTYVSLNRQDAFRYASDTLSAKSGVAVVVMHSDENYMRL